MRLRISSSKPDRPRDGCFTVLTERGGVRHLLARGRHGPATQVFLEAARMLDDELGLVLVEGSEPPREWVNASLGISVLLGVLVSVRDLLGRGRLDAALFSPDRGVEIYLDRMGLLEIRAGGWWEPHAVALLERHGFRRVPGLPAPPPRSSEPTWSREEMLRFAAARDALALEHPAAGG